MRDSARARAPEGGAGRRVLCFKGVLQCFFPVTLPVSIGDF
jgi:hypothetical protein